MDLGKYIGYLLEGDKIKGPKALLALENGTLLLGVIFSIIMVVIAAIIAKSIYSVPDRSDIGKRKRWFWFLMGFAPILFTLYNYFIIINNVSIGNASSFKSLIGINFITMILTYVGFGFILSFIFKKGVIGDWFFSSKKYK